MPVTKQELVRSLSDAESQTLLSRVEEYIDAVLQEKYVPGSDDGVTVYIADIAKGVEAKLSSRMIYLIRVLYESHGWSVLSDSDPREGQYMHFV